MRHTNYFATTGSYQYALFANGVRGGSKGLSSLKMRRLRKPTFSMNPSYAW